MVGVREDQYRGAFLFPPKTHRLAKDKTASKWLPLARTVRDAIGGLGIPNGAPNPLPKARRLTVRESARIQTFPDWYEYLDDKSGYTLVGNAVPPLYAKQLAISILEYDARPIRSEIET